MSTLQSTQALYGVDPKELAEMPYKDALDVMEKGLWTRKRKLADDLYKCTDGDIASQIQDQIRKVSKAIDLTYLRQEEIKSS